MPASWRCARCSTAAPPKARSEAAYFVFVPVFNVDGHERFGRWNRPNQRGPEEMGWRTTAQNLNLNRDYVKAEAPEMQAMLRLLNEWDPLLYVDLHVTDGAEVRARHLVQRRRRRSPATRSFAHAPARAARRADAPIGGAGFAAARFLSVASCETTIRNPASRSSVAPPRFSQRTGRCAIASACWSKRTRGRTTRRACASPAIDHRDDGAGGNTAANGCSRARRGRSRARNRRLDRRASIQQHRSREDDRLSRLRIHAQPSAVSGALMTRYDNKRPQIWRIPLQGSGQPTVTR